MGDTQVYTKVTLIESLQKMLEDDDIILVSGDLVGNVTVKPKINEKRVTLGFAADAFKLAGDIRHFAFGHTPILALAVCKRKDVSDNTIKLFENVKTKENKAAK